MPVLLSHLSLDTLIARNITSQPSVPGPIGPANEALKVICAWPVSGQYGPGSRVLYYVLVAACVFARKTKWLRKACLAAALLLPAVAAIHGIVLVAVHVNGAVDMDVYGAFQLCSIGILAAPVTVKLSQTYFDNPGRNTIFLWTGLVLAGLLSLTVEFYRIKTSDCTHSDSGKPIPPDAGAFPYNESPTCGLICTVQQGPFSPIRGGSANNIYVIPAPTSLTFGTATLLAAACCIPAILSLITMWIKILETNAKKNENENDNVDLPIEERGGIRITTGQMKSLNAKIRSILSGVEIPIFGGAVLAILSIGERNFFSAQVRYQTEPMANIGEWAPIVGTGLAALGSLYLLMKKDEKSDPSLHPCKCLCHHHGCEQCQSLHMQPSIAPSQSDQEARSTENSVVESPLQRALEQASTCEDLAPLRSVATPEAVHMRSSTSNDMVSVPSRPSLAQSQQDRRRSSNADAGHRNTVAGYLINIEKKLGSPRKDMFDDSDIKRGLARNYPETPGEPLVNPHLDRTRAQYNPQRDEQGNATPEPRTSRSHSRARSSDGGAPSPDRESSSNRARTESPHRQQSPRSPSPFILPIAAQKATVGTSLSQETSYELRNLASSSSADATRVRRQYRGDSIEATSPTHLSPTDERRSTFPSRVSTDLEKGQSEEIEEVLKPP